MPSDKSADRLSAAEEVFKNLLLEAYDLEPDFVDAVCKNFRKAATPLAEASVATKRTRNASDKPKKTRKKSAYNVYVREMMKTPDIKDLDHKQKMGAIAKLWKELSADDRTPYAEMANDENSAVVVAIVPESTEVA
jgi:hypothetical protein